MNEDIAVQIREILEPLTEVGDAHAPLQLSSLDYVDVTAGLEERFDIIVRGAEIIPENFATLSKLVAFVERKIAEQ